MRIVSVGTLVMSEVLTSQALRWALKMKPNWRDATIVHTLSVPYLGGAGAIGGIEPKAVKIQDNYTTQFESGIRGIPAVILAQYILETQKTGKFFHFNFDKWEFFVTLVAKALSKPMFSTVLNFLPTTMQDRLDVIYELIARQQQASNFNMK